MYRKLTLSLALLCAPLLANDPTWKMFKDKQLKSLKYWDGWCSEEKARKMMDLIYEVKPELCVEIGVFGGSSIYPTASALSSIGQGTVVAIDPWSNEDCMKGYSADDTNYLWWRDIDLENILLRFKNNLRKAQLSSFCDIMRMTSSEAVLNFPDESIDILHIDGNHTEDSALADARMFFPKVKQGGYIWFDDINWASTKSAVSFLSEFCDIDMEKSISGLCLLFKKR